MKIPGKILRALEDGRVVRYTLEWCLGMAGTVSQSVDLTGLTKCAAEHMVLCHRRDNTPFKHARFVVEDEKC